MGDSLDPSVAPSIDHFFDHFFGPSLLHFLLDFQSETAIVTLCLLVRAPKHARDWPRVLHASEFKVRT